MAQWAKMLRSRDEFLDMDYDEMVMETKAAYVQQPPRK